MKRTVTYIIFVVVALTSCGRYDTDGYKFDNSLYINVSATSQLQSATFGNKATSVTKKLSAMLAYPEKYDVTATILLDESLVDEYNTRYGTDYDLLPAQYSDFKSQTITIPAGRTTSETVDINFIGLAGEGEDQSGALEIDKTYLFPVRILSDDIDILQGSSVAYYLVRRSSAITTAADITDNYIYFPTLDTPGSHSSAFNGLDAVTYEALVFIDRFDEEYAADGSPCNISTIMGVEQYLLLRIGDTNFEREQLQLDGSGVSFGKFPDSDASKKLGTGQWYHIAATYDTSTKTVCIYVNGQIQSIAEEMGDGSTVINLAMRAMGENMTEAYQFFIGGSFFQGGTDPRPLQGKIAEVRVWSVARTQEQIWDNMYRIENPQNDETLLGYWKFDDGKGNTVKDYSRYGNDGIAAYDLIWPDGIEIPEINKVN